MSLQEIKQKSNLCACGCGQEILPKPHHKRLGTPKYRWGHGSKGRHIVFPESAKQLLRIANLGKIQSQETIQKRVVKLTGKVRTPEMRENYRPSKLGEKNSQFGKHKTEEQKEKVRQSWRKTFVKNDYKTRHPQHLPQDNPKYQQYCEKRRQTRLHIVYPKRDSFPEKILQSSLKLTGITFSTHIPIIGQPDIFIKPNMCVFCDGDFWHGYKTMIPKNNIIWTKRLFQKRKKDAEINKSLRKQGYIVLRFWEHQIKGNPTHCIERIILNLEKKKRE